MSEKVFVAGHRGMVGSAILRALQARGGAGLVTRTHRELDLTDQAAVRAFFERERPTQVYLAAAKVGGILANNVQRADFIEQNLQMQTNVLVEARRAGVNRLLFLGSSCIYPKLAEQPMTEAALLTGPLEATNRPYALAKIAGIEMCDASNRQHGTDFRAAMPTNLYGPGDNFDLNGSHVIPALIRKFHEAKLAGAREVIVWGSGTPRREFLHVDDLAQACLHLMDLPKDRWQALETTHVNVGCGEDLTIAELAERVRRTVGFEGAIIYDRAKPDGTPRKLLDIGLIRKLGWAPRIDLDEGLAAAYRWFLEHHAEARL